MDRRYFLKGLGAGTVGLSLPLIASSARSCKIIGIGGAGCNFMVGASRSGAIPASSKWVPEFICIDLDQNVLNYIDADNAAMPGCAPITTLSLATLGSAGRVNRGRAAALRKRDALRAMLTDTDVVFLVAGLGGGTGSGVTPIMARLAREAGALTVAAVVTPFGWQRWRTPANSNTAISHLNREADLVVRFSNQELMEALRDDITQDDFFASQNQRIAVFIRGLMDRVNPIS